MFKIHFEHNNGQLSTSEENNIRGRSPARNDEK